MSSARQGIVRVGAPVFLLLLGACKAGDPETTHRATPDAGIPTLEAPRLVPGLPTRTPLASIALRGNAKGSKVVVTGGKEQAVVFPLPSGDFCGDVTLKTGEQATLRVTTLDEGKISPVTKHVVTQDSAAPSPVDPYCNPPICNGPCPTTETSCNNSLDDDFDGLVDDCDTDCNGCQDDAMIPNDYPASVPRLWPGKTYDLKICPCLDDWFSFPLAKDKTLYVDALFGGQIDIDLELFKAEDAEDGGYKTNTPVSSSKTSSSQESIEYTSRENQVYYLRVSVQNTSASGSYQLVVY